jgi:hypothetical protein
MGRMSKRCELKMINQKSTAGKVKLKLNPKAASYLSRYYKRKRVELKRTINNEEGD